jgi:hypothetical protein
MTKCPEGSPWDWGDLTDKELIKLSELSALDGRGPESPLFQYFAVRTVLALQSGITAGSGFDVLRAVAECARCGLVMPDWLARAFLNRYRAVTQFEAKSWDDPLSFGPPYPKGTNIRAKRKARSKGRELYVRVNALRAQHPDKSLVSAFDEVGTDMGIGKTLAEEYYYANKARFASTIVNKQAPRKINQNSGETEAP